MQDAIGSLTRHAARAACLLLVVAAGAAAQTPFVTSPAPAPETPQFMSRSDFYLAVAGLSSDDDRFSFDGHVGGDFDILDYVAGRATLVADYHVGLGNQFQIFDPNQGNYTLDASASLRLRGVELAGVFHHLSRHLGDRQRTRTNAWNELEARALGRIDLGDGTTVDLVGQVGKVINWAGVDYSWTAGADVTVRHDLKPWAGIFARGLGRTIGVESGRIAWLDRGQQFGGRVEGGVRLKGKGGAVELYAGFERVIDAHPLDMVPMHWAFAGFRVLSN